MSVTMSLVMHLYQLLACFVLISSVLVCVVLHPFLQVGGIFQEFGFGLAPFGWGVWTGPFGVHCDFGNGFFSVPLELSGQKESGLHYEAPTLWGCTIVCIGKNIANCGKSPQFLPVVCALCTLCRHAPKGCVDPVVGTTWGRVGTACGM